MSKSKHAPAHQATPADPFSSLSPTMRDIACIALLYIIVLILFRGIIFGNGAFASTGDTAAAVSYAHAGNQIAQAEGVDVLWMPYFFSGMPTFGNVAYIPHDVSYFQRIGLFVLNLLFLNGPWTWFVVFYFFNGASMFLLLRVWKFSRAASLIAAVAVMLSPYAMGLAAEGHGSKLMALSYLPSVFLLTHLVFERRDVLSFGLLSAAIGTLMLTNHMQIVYYVFMTIGFYLLYAVVLDVKANRKRALIKVLLFTGALVVGMGIASYVYLSVYEYAQYSIRGGGTAGASGGLSYDYATSWSWNPWEIFTLLIPGFFGFQSPYYWGTKPFSSSTVYIGVLPWLLATVALIYSRTRIVLFFTAATVLVMLISFGGHFSLLYGLLFNSLPFFNKFRAPEMILHLLPFTVGFLAAYGFTFLTETHERTKPFDPAPLRRGLMYAGGGLLALLLLALMFKSSFYDSMTAFMFEKPEQADQLRQQYGQRAAQILSRLKEYRFEILWKDFIKFALIGIASLGLVLAFLTKKIRGGMLAGGLICILAIDLILVDVNFINPKPAAAIEEAFRPDASVTFLKQQPGLFRVLPLGPDLFPDNTFAYHAISSVGGYSPAKLKIYQTMIDSCLYRGPDPAFPLNMSVIDMLNVRYILAQGRLPEDRFQLVNSDLTKRLLTYNNPGGLPRAFFVRNVVIAKDDHEVFDSLNSASFDPSRTAVLYKQLPESIAQSDTPHAEVSEYQSRRIAIKTSASAPGLLVLSEVFYPAGWKAFIDGAETEIYRTNYVLRSVLVPSGVHTVLFVFDPPLYRLGYTLSRVSWGVALLCILVGLWQRPAIRRLIMSRMRRDSSHHG